jgi:hypothetical protein
MKKLLLTLFALLTLMIASGCGSNSQNAQTAQVRVMQGSPDIGSVDALIDGQVIASNLGFRGVFPLPTTNYLPVKAGNRDIQEVRTGTTSPTLAAVTLKTSSNNFYTVLTVGEESRATLSTLVLNDDHSSPAVGQLKFRLVHGASGIGAVDVYLTSQPTDPVPTTPAITNFSFKAVTSYESVSGPGLQLCMNPAGVVPASMNSCLLSVQFLPTSPPLKATTLIVLDPPTAGGGGVGNFTSPVVFASLPY